MEEFLKQNYYLLTHSIEFLAAITGLFVYNKYKFTAAKYFIWFLWYLSIGDQLGSYVQYIGDSNFLHFLKGTVFAWNYWWYTLFWEIGAILFFTFYFYKILRNKKFSSIVKFLGIAFFVVSVSVIVFNLDQFFTGYFDSINIIGAFIIFIVVIFHFIEILNSNVILSFHKSINFYISGTILIWWLVTTPLVFYEIYNFNRDLNFNLLKKEIYLLANLFMYLTFTFALIWCKPQKD
ncbi:MAG: hypothetical protein ABJL44_09865 [Algibacter sp.]